MTEPNLFVILPAYNEVRSLEQLIPEISKTLSGRSFQICVVDDGSNDATPQLLEKFAHTFPVHTVRHDPNQGYGAAIRSGMTWALERASPDDVVLTLDADRSHLPEYFLPMVQKVHQGFDVVTASYRLPSGRAVGVSLKRRILSDLVNALFGYWLRVDGAGSYTNGFRAYRASILEKVRGKGPMILETGFPGGTEIFLRVCAAGARVGEIPFVLHYENRGADSKINIKKTIQGYLRLLIKAHQIMR